jgi:hypothetical protein
MSDLIFPLIVVVVWVVLQAFVFPKMGVGT